MNDTVQDLIVTAAQRLVGRDDALVGSVLDFAIPDYPVVVAIVHLYTIQPVATIHNESVNGDVAGASCKDYWKSGAGTAQRYTFTWKCTYRDPG